MIFFVVTFQIPLNERLPAVITSVRHLLSVLPNVGYQSVLTCKSHAAVVTAGRFYTCVQASMMSRITIFSESLSIGPISVRPLCSVLAKVDYQ